MVILVEVEDIVDNNREREIGPGRNGYLPCRTWMLRIEILCTAGCSAEDDHQIDLGQDSQ